MPGCDRKRVGIVAPATQAKTGQAGGKSATTSGQPIKAHLKQANPLPCERPLFNAPRCLAFDAAGNLLIADEFNYRVRKVTPEGVLSTIAGNGENGHSGDGGPATEASIYGSFLLTDMKVQGNQLYFSGLTGNINGQQEGDGIRAIDLETGIINRFAGTYVSGFEGLDGPALDAQLYYPYGMAFVGSDLYVSQINSDLLVVSNGILTSLPVRPGYYRGLISDGANLAGFVQDEVNSQQFQLRKTIIPSGDISDIPVNLIYPYGIAYDPVSGDYFTFSGYRDGGVMPPQIYRVSPTGEATLFAGNGTEGYSGDGGLALNAQFRFPENTPTGLVVHNGHLYVSDTGNNCVRRINLTTGIVTLYAGTPEMGGFEGDGGQAVVPEVAGPGVFEFSAAEYTVEENAGVATLEITRTDGGCGELFVEFTTHPGTATVPEDFTEITTGVTFADGETGSRQVLIPITDDANAEPPESFTVEIINWLGDAEIGENFLATVVITDNDGQPAPVITSIDPNKGAAGTSFWASLKGMNLGGSPTIEILGGGGITVSDLTVRSSEELVARFAIAANAPVGFRQIQVRKANAQVSNTVPFEIRPAGSAPRILSQSQNTTIEYAETARLEVFAAGTGSLTYQWYAGFAGLTDVPIVGATSRTYVTDQLTTTTSFWVRVRNANGVADSQTITITVNPPEAATFGFSQLLYIPGVEQLLVFSATDALYLAQLYYDPIVSVNLKDQTGTTLINAPNQHFAFFRALPAEQGDTYTLKSHHCLDIFYTVVVTPPNDFKYDDEFNFSGLQSDQVYSDGFIWLAEGPQILTVEQRLCLGFTTDQQTAAGCTGVAVNKMTPSELPSGNTTKVKFIGDCFGTDASAIKINITNPDFSSVVWVFAQNIEVSSDGKILTAEFIVRSDAPESTVDSPYRAQITVAGQPP
ncbi:MAG TPA: Calx-beta domain-containing protein, partial [Acidobacteriota bacterium]|nr:Calx-beta domain-containing protein [Acidobacteriota bacterium]